MRMSKKCLNDKKSNNSGNSLTFRRIDGGSKMENTVIVWPNRKQKPGFSPSMEARIAGI